MPETQQPLPLAPDVAARLTAFARACKGAARAVGLYPPEHPAIEVALTRVTEAAAAITERGRFTMLVTPDTLLVDGKAPSRAEVAIAELAALLHRQMVGELTLSPGIDAGSWRMFLALVGVDPEEIRSQGGIARAWATAGGHGLDVQELDYASLLAGSESGEQATWDAIITNCLRVDALDMDEETVRVLSDIASDADRLSDFVARLEEQSAAHHDAKSRSRTLLRVLSHVAEYIQRTNPESFDLVLQNMATAAARLNPDVMFELLALARSTGGADEQLVKEVARRITDPMLARFIARSVAAERGCTARLAEVFKSLAPAPQRQQAVLRQARQELAASPFGDEAGFEQVWASAEALLFSYSDAPFVSEAYNQELSTARARALEIENVTDDPPERIAGWMTSVSDKALRELDLDLLADLLRVESEVDRWREVADLVVEHIDDLILIGDFTGARHLLEAFTSAGIGRDAARATVVSTGLDRLVSGQMMSTIATHLNSMGDLEVDEVRGVCEVIGPPLIPRLAETLAGEERPRARQRLTQLLIAFGEHGRDSVEHLRRSPSPSVRRTAVQLLRSFGGHEALGEIAEMLEDPEPNVQRESVRALIAIGNDEAYETLERALTADKSRARAALMQELSATRDERATRLLCFIVHHMDCRGTLREIYMKALARLGVLGGTEAVDALADVLRKGQWWAPWRWNEVWGEAAASLAKINTPESLQALSDAATGGAPGARHWAKRQLKAGGA